MLALSAALFVFLAVLLGMLAIQQLRLENTLADRRIRSLRAPQRQTAAPVILRQVSAIPAMRGFLADNAWAERARLDLERANLRLRVGEYLLARVCLAAVLGFIGLVLVDPPLGKLLLGIVLGVLGFMLPAFYVDLLRRRRIRAIEGQLVETLTLIANGVRSGFAFLQGVHAAARQLSPPMSEELERVIHDTNVGVPTEQALLDMSRRVGSYDLDMAITAISIQRTTGGNLSEILENVAETIRERERVQGEINTLTAEKRLSGNILAVYPSAIAALMFLIRPSLMSILLDEPAGWALLGLALALQVIGYLIIRRIVAIEI